MNIFRKMLFWILIWIFAIYLLFGLLLFFYQRKLIYYPTKQDFYSCPAFDDSQKINYQGTRFYYKENSEKLAVFYHGNAGSACDRGYIKEFFDERDYSFVIVEYAGYSNDTKKPSQKLILNDVTNINEFIGKQHHSRVFVFGESVGSGAASYHASIARVDKVVLIAPFKNLEAFAENYYPFYPIRLLLKEKYPNDEWLKNYKGKVVIIHGTKDNIVPPEQSRGLHDSITTDKEYIEIEDADHNNLYGFQKTEASIKNILD